MLEGLSFASQSCWQNLLHPCTPAAHKQCEDLVEPPPVGKGGEGSLQRRHQLFHMHVQVTTLKLKVELVMCHSSLCTVRGVGVSSSAGTNSFTCMSR